MLMLISDSNECYVKSIYVVVGTSDSNECYMNSIYIIVYVSKDE